MTELEYAQSYNAEFSRLNPQVPMNAKWDPIQQMKYLKDLLARQKVTGSTAYAIPYVSQINPAPAVTPVTPNTTTNTPVSLAEVLTSARYLVTQLEALQR